MLEFELTLEFELELALDALLLDRALVAPALVPLALLALDMPCVAGPPVPPGGDDSLQPTAAAPAASPDKNCLLVGLPSAALEHGVPGFLAISIAS